MSLPDRERLDALSESLARILRRQDEIDERLRRLETRANPRPESAPVPPPLPIATPPAPVDPLPARDAPPTAPSPHPRESALETKLGLNWINRIGVVTLLFAAAFGFDYAVQNNWIGPGARVALGLIAAVISAFSADRVHQRGHEIFAQGLTGLAIALSYLTLYASFTIYHVFPRNLAFILMILTTAGAVALALRYCSQAIAILGLIGGYLTPILLSSGPDHPAILLTYTFLLNAGAISLARARRWQAAEYLALVSTAILYTARYFEYSVDTHNGVEQFFAVAYYAQFLISPLAPVWTISQFLIAFAAAAIWNDPAAVLFLALLAAAAGLLVAEWRHWSGAPAWTLACYWFCYLAWRVDNSPDEPLFLFVMLSCGFLLFAAWTLFRAILKTRPFAPAELIVIAANGAAYFVASGPLLAPQYHHLLGAFAVLIGGIHLAIAKLLWTDHHSDWSGLLALGVTLAFLTLAVPIQFAGFRITVAWSLEAAALAWLAARFNQRRFQFASWIVFTLVAFHLLLSDARLVEPAAIVNARFLAFAVTAVSLWLAAKFARQGIAAAAPYIAGHIALISGLALEIDGWAARTVSAGNLWSTESTAFSILLALYALVLISLGVAARSVLNRILGLVMLAIVIAKLYLSDVWSLGLGFRIAAFLALGVLLLLVSYLYSRFKSVIEHLWKNDGSECPNT